MAHDYRNMTANQAAALAKDIAEDSYRSVHGVRLTNQIIANMTGFGVEAIQRYFCATDNYSPGLQHIPALCRALGNTIMFDWLKAQMVDLLPTEDPMTTAAAVARSAVQISAQSGKVCEVVDEVIKDDIVEPHEAMQLDAELAHLADHTQKARVRLVPIIAQHKRR